MDKKGRLKVGIVIFLVLIGIFSVYFVVAGTDSTSFEYNESERTVYLPDVTMKLDTPQNVYVIAGKDRKIAEITVNSAKELMGFVEGMKTYDVRNSKELSELNKINREFTYKIKEMKLEDYEVYETVCDTKIIEIFHKANETDSEWTETRRINENCTRILDRIEQREVVDWIPLENNFDLPKGKSTIGIFTDVKRGDEIEWIPTFAGVEINQWAGWTEGLEVDLISYWTMNESSGNIIDSHQGFDGIAGGTPTYSKPGIQGSAIYFSGDDWFDVTGINSTSQSYTFQFWINSSYNYASPSDGYIFDNGDPSRLVQQLSQTSQTNAMGFYDGAHHIWANNPATTGDFVHIITTFNATSSNATLYVDGNAVASASYTGKNIDGTVVIASIQDMDGSSTVKEATLDEIAVWERVLTYDEITQLYNNGEGIPYGVEEDTTPPETSIPILNSTDGTNRSNQDLNCYATLTDNLQTNLTAYWKWYKNDEVHLSGDTTVQNGTESLISVLNSGNISKGEQWICEVKPFDGVNLGNASNSTAVTILNTPPTHSNPLLSTPSGKNFSSENLTCYNQSTSDADNDAVINIYNWYKNSQPLMALNLPFENNTNDYSDYENHGARNGTIFVNGKIGKALSFDGVDDYVEIPDSNSLDITGDLTLEAWIYSKNISGRHTFIVKGGENWNYVNYLLRTNEDEIEFKWYNSGFETHITNNVNLVADNWYHIVAVHNANNNIAKIYVNGVEKLSESTIKTKLADTRPLSIGIDRDINGNLILPFDGMIDEMKVYPYALTPEQINANYNLEYNTIVSEQTSGGDGYMCQITPNDGEEDGDTLDSNNLSVLWAISFNVRSGEDGSQLSNFNINCNNSFSVSGVSSPYTTGFFPGDYECLFRSLDFYNKTITFTANNDTTINVKLSRTFSLTVEEHTWLEAIYNCLYSGDCSLYNLLLEVNQTVGKVWEHTKPTDQSVVTFRNVTNNIVDSTHNLTIDYNVNIPIKAGYSLGTYLPIRIGFWFLDETNTTCYNQGDKPTGVEEPYCQPLIIETLGPMGGSVSFTTKLHPQLPAGNYSIKEMVDIDPNNVWINYGQELISTFTMAESLSNYGISIEKTGEDNPVNDNQQQSTRESSSGSSDNNEGSVTNIYNIYNVTNVVQENKTKDNPENKTDKSAGITGSMIKEIFSEGNFILTIILIIGLLAVFIYRKIKKK